MAMDWVPSVLLQHRTVVGSAPGAGQEWVFTVPAGKIWVPKALTVTLVQGATQQPQPVLIMDDGANIFAGAMGATTAQPASTTVTYCWAPNMVLSGIQPTSPAADGHAQSPLPGGGEMAMLPGWRIRSHTISAGVNTVYGAPVLYVAEDQ